MDGHPPDETHAAIVVTGVFRLLHRVEDEERVQTEAKQAKGLLVDWCFLSFEANVEVELPFSNLLRQLGPLIDHAVEQLLVLGLQVLNENSEC